MPDAATDLFGEKIKQGSRGLTHTVLQIHRINFIPVEISRKQDFSEAIEDVDNAFLGWNRLVINVRVALPITAALNNVFGNLG